MSGGDRIMAVLTTAALWLGWSLLVGVLANQLPLRWLEDPQQDACSTHHHPARAADGPWLAIRHWKRWIPDAGDALPGGIRKASLARRNGEALQRLIAETRRAELVHWCLWPIWLVTALWLPPIGVALNLAFATLINLPCMLLQRFNRGRLQTLLSRHGERLRRATAGRE